MARKKVEEVKESINTETRKKYGKSLVVSADEVDSVTQIRRPTGLPNLDMALAGGFPSGTICEIAGPDSSGKNALVYQTAATYQLMRPKRGILLCPIEGEIDKQFARKLGFRIPASPIDLARREKMLGRKLSREEVDDLTKIPGTVAYITLDNAEAMLTQVLECTASDDFGLVVIDSMAALLAQDDMERKEGNRTVEVPVGGERPYARNINAAIGSFTNRFQHARKNKPHGRLNHTTVLAINQVRADVSGKSYLPWKVPGSFALRHAKRVSIHLNYGAQIKDEKTNRVVGHYVRWSIAKGQYGARENAKGSIAFHYDTGFDIVDDLFSALHERNMVTHTGGGRWDLCDCHGEVIESFGRDAGGKDGLIAALRASPEMRARWLEILQTELEFPPLFEGWDE